MVTTLMQSYQDFKQFAGAKLYKFLEFIYYFKPRALLAFLIGLCCALGHPPFKLFPCFVIGIVAIIRLIDFCQNRKDAFIYGVCFFYGLALGLYYWISFSLFVDWHYYILIPVALAVLPLAYALPHALMFVIYKDVSNYTNATQRVAFFAFIWCFFEYLRSFLIIKFPWALTGYVLSFSKSMLQISSVIGTFGLSVYVMLFASFMHLILLNGDGDAYYRYLRYILSFVLSFICLFVYGFTTLSQNKTSFRDDVNLRLVQGGIKTAVYYGSNTKQSSTDVYEQMTKTDGLENITHIIWPESAVEHSVYENPFINSRLASGLLDGQILLTGSLRVEEQLNTDMSSNLKLYNTITMLNSDGKEAYYDKHFLVPFGEYIPFRRFMPFANNITNGAVDFTPGESMRVYQLYNTPAFLPLVCYEIGFSGSFPIYSKTKYKDIYGIERIKKTRLEWIVNLTNDAWFGYSSGPFQHFEMTRLRAIEYGVPVVRAANSGITAIIDPYGRIVKKLGLGKKGVIDCELPKSRDLTVFSTLGNTPAVIIVCLAVFVFIILALHNRFAKKINPIITMAAVKIDKSLGRTNKKYD